MDPADDIFQLARRALGEQPAADPAPDDVVQARIRTVFRNGYVELEVSLTSELELGTYGLTVALRDGSRRHESGAWGDIYARQTRQGVRLFAKLKPGTYRARYIVLVYVRLAQGHWATWSRDDLFEVTV